VVSLAAPVCVSLLRVRLRGMRVSGWEPVRKGRTAIVAAVALLFVGGLAVAVVAYAAREPSHARSGPLLGDRGTGPSGGSASAGRPEAFRFRAGRTGKARSVAVFIGSKSTAATFATAIYSDAHGRPARLLRSTGSVRADKGAWNRVRMKPVSIRRGGTYWLAVMGAGGTLVYRDRSKRGCTHLRSGQARGGWFPGDWARGSTERGCAISAFLDSSKRGRLPKASPGSGRPPAPGPGGSTSPPTTGTSPGATPPGVTQTNCVTVPSSCGYPDPSNTGVPVGTVLTLASDAALPAGVTWRPGDLVITQNNVTISGLEVVGSILVEGNNVTIENTLVNDPDYDQAIHTSGTNGLVVKNSTIHGASASSPGSQGILGPAVVDGDYIYNEVEGVEGTGMTIQDSYILSNGSVSNGHNEPVDVDDGVSDATVIRHNTLLNPLNQTAAIIAGGPWGPVENVTIDDNLVAGGGYTIYCCEATAWGVSAPSSNTAITNNRFSRLYFQSGGSFGPLADLNKKLTTFTGNFWDETLKPVTP
jgi:hypothetical protein